MNRILLYTGGYVLAACAVISLYLSGLLQLSSGQWRDFFILVAGAFMLIFPGMIAAHWRVFSRIRVCLDAYARGDHQSEAIRDGFETLADFPRYWYTWGLGWWVLGGIAVGGGLWLSHPELGALPPAIVLTATVSAALITDTYYYLTIKQFLEPARTALAIEIGDSAVRESLTRRVSLRVKLLTAMTSVILVTVVFAGFLAQVSIERALARFGVENAHRTLDAITANGPTDLEIIESGLARYGASFFMIVLDEQSGERKWGVSGALSDEDHAWLVEQDAVTRDSTPLGSGRAFAWRRLAALETAQAGESAETDEMANTRASLLVIGVPSQRLMVDSGVRTAFAGLILFSSLVAIGVAYLLSRDIGRATERLSAQAARIAAGDLTPSEPLESEDDMGALARSFEHMTTALRATVERVASAADRMQHAASEIAGASHDVAIANERQAEKITRASGSMEEIDRQVEEIASSAERLCSDVDSASSAITQLGSAGGELESNAMSLASSVDDVSSSIEELATSITQVATSSDVVAEAAEGASGSMMETSAAVQQVSESTTTMSGIAAHVVELSEQGNERVRETVRGMRAIHEATKAAQQVIHELASSAERIDSVISVIDGVADETNLLALNAAIIAAQAGEQGKPFAVVAAEVKSLASRVQSSTAEITKLIRALQQRSENASEAIERGAALVLEGVARSGDAGSSLDAITSAARESGVRVSEIVNAMNEQSKAVTIVADLMNRVREGTEQIRHALREQDRNTALLRQSSSAVGDVSKQVRRTTVENRQSTGSIGQSMQSVQESVDLIKRTLQQQSLACRSAVEFLDGVRASTHSNESSVQQLEASMRGLQEKADELHAEVARFRT